MTLTIIFFGTIFLVCLGLALLPQNVPRPASKEVIADPTRVPNTH
jgi:hypothetical protein